ncbi:MAG: beta-carotene hydroxylase [Bacteroidia bacterium]|nr:beta-carotene hydroxylase [Bacteroidia bacterium]
MIYLWYLTVVLLSFGAMEAIAWLLHKYVMHGFLWRLHEDHHRPHDRKFEKNDYFALVFAFPAWLFTMFGIMDGLDYKLYVGIGVTLYGICYVLVHDGLIHQRFKIFSRIENPWLIALRRGHKAHHKHLGKHNAECFGMLIVPYKYFKEAKVFSQQLRRQRK